MKYVIREKFWSFADRFHILDRKRNNLFLVEVKRFSWGERMSFQDMQGNELACVLHKRLPGRPKYEIHRGGALFAEMTQGFVWSNRKFILDVPGPDDYEIRRSFWRDRYRFLRNRRCVATVCRAFWAWTETFVVRIEAGEDDVSILCAVIVIDQVAHDREYRKELARIYGRAQMDGVKWRS